ncbi:unnamed protein product, partial [marine sediment metagenome]
IAAAAAGVTLNVNVKSQTANINVNLAASAITLNINVKSQEAGLNLNINIAAAAAAVTLNINIKSQTANINVNVAASAATVTVSVTGTANINITAQSVAIYNKPDWEVKEGNQKYLYGSATLASWATVSTLVNYTVPEGKTLYIYGISGYAIASAAANGDLPQHVGFYMVIVATTTVPVGGDGGGSFTYGAPIKVVGDDNVILNAYSGSNHSISAAGALLGFEV